MSKINRFRLAFSLQRGRRIACFAVSLGILATGLGFGLGAPSGTSKSRPVEATEISSSSTLAYGGGRLMAANPLGGYWTVNQVGAVAPYGGAQSFGSPALSGLKLSKPVVGMAATPDGQGYWLVATDGGIFTFGDAKFFGSTGAIHLNQPVVGMAATPDGQGYWLVASDGGIFTFGDAKFFGSLAGGSDSVLGIVISPETAGYSLIQTNGISSVFPQSATVSSPTSVTPGVVGSSVTPGGAPSSAISGSAANSAFVKQSGTTLTLGGLPYTFRGINIYMAASGGTPSSCGGELYPNVGVPLSDMPNGVVIRFFAFQDFFVSNGSFNWSNFDQVLSLAAAHDDKVIPVLANEHSYCDGPEKDLSWYQTGYQSTVEPGDIVPYDQYVTDIVSRYADNATIAMWQLVNEGEAVNSDGTCNEPAAHSALLAFSDNVGEMVHSLDPNHLVSLGTLAGYSGSGAQWCGAANGDYQTLMASPGNDVCDFHDYGYPNDPMGNPVTPDLATAIQMCHAVGKPIMAAETGIYADDPQSLSARAAEFSAKFAAQFQAGVVGDLMWCWTAKPAYVVPDADPDYGISAGDPALAVLGAI